MTAAPGEVTRTPSVDQLHAALGRLRLGGAIFLRSQFTEAWAYESPPGDQTAAMLHNIDGIDYGEAVLCGLIVLRL